MKIINNYWTDKNNNKWDASLFDEKAAKQLSETLTDCTDCENCTNCNRCNNCTNCTSCTDCDDCEDCKNRSSC